VIGFIARGCKGGSAGGSQTKATEGREKQVAAGVGGGQRGFQRSYYLGWFVRIGRTVKGDAETQRTPRQRARTKRMARISSIRRPRVTYSREISNAHRVHPALSQPKTHVSRISQGQRAETQSPTTLSRGTDDQLSVRLGRGARIEGSADSHGLDLDQAATSPTGMKLDMWTTVMRGSMTPLRPDHWS